jgi:hypothetical protein
MSRVRALNRLDQPYGGLSTRFDKVPCRSSAGTAPRGTRRASAGRCQASLAPTRIAYSLIITCLTTV